MNCYSSILLTIAALVLFSPLNIYACACCADEGYYRISVAKPDDYMLGEFKKLRVGETRLYTTPAYPDDIKGLDPKVGKYTVETSVSADGWSFAFTGENGKTGTLALKMPKKFVDYAVDTQDGKWREEPSGQVSLYKEWRFKAKVKDGSGIFKDGMSRGTEYFLVFQGSGNACNSADDIKAWRLEITGRKASYAFYGRSGEENSSDSSTKAGNGETQRKPVKQAVKVSNLVGSGYSGCGCSGWRFEDLKDNSKKPMFWSEFKSDGSPETLIMNIGGKDTELKLLKKAPRPEKEKVGDKFSDEYLADGMKVVLEYTTKKLPCEECEGTDYDVVATVIGEYSGKVMTLFGSCGC